MTQVGRAPLPRPAVTMGSGTPEASMLVRGYGGWYRRECMPSTAVTGTCLRCNFLVIGSLLLFSRAMARLVTGLRPLGLRSLKA